MSKKDPKSNTPENIEFESKSPRSEKPSLEMTRRDALRSIGTGTIAAALSGAFAQQVSAETGCAAPGPIGKQPYATIRIVEQSETLAGRLAGLLFADQGAEVIVERAGHPGKVELDDTYFDRGKLVLAPGTRADLASADVIIVDGVKPVQRTPNQIVLRITAAVPGDEEYGYLPADCSEDLLNALVGFFTDMSVTGQMLGRPVIYTPLPLCSVYAGVNGSVAVAAALVDRERSGQGRDIVASRMASGLSAIGALSLTSKGLPAHLQPVEIGGLPVGMTPAQFQAIAAEARVNPARQQWLEQRFAPLSAPFPAKDGRLILPMAAPNRRLTRRALQALGLWDKALAAGMVDVSAFDPANQADARRNLADSLALNFALTSALADMLEPIFLTRTATEWERFLIANGVAATVIQTWEDWQKDPNARAAAIFSQVDSADHVQIGRSSWVKSAQPYPPLAPPRRASTVPPRTAAASAASTNAAPSHRPLAGYTVLDLSNVVAGPSCGRMLGELGATIVSVVPMDPYQSPTIVVDWAGELSAGKQSIILDTHTPGGSEVLQRLSTKCDFVLMNAFDDQMARLRIDKVSMATRNPSAIGIQISALRGDRCGPRQNDPGYDPSQQGTTGVMTRFGDPGAPTFHGIASCVDYLCGYLGVWAAVTALYAREHRRDGHGDWAETSLATAATLTQLLLQTKPEPATARGQSATGMNAGERVYKLSDGWIFAQAPNDMSQELAPKTVADAIAHLKQKSIYAVPVQTCKQVADRSREKPTQTVQFQKTEKDGWQTECFAPTWFIFDGKAFPRSSPASRIGADGPAILAKLGYNQQEIAHLISSGSVGRTEWAKS
jgi:crotonobetainyl-CoA:carnitine CoA-transferase CaiB-like acyl-CoA transferase